MAEIKPVWASYQEALDQLDSRLNRLSLKDAQGRLHRYGYNELEEKRESKWLQFLKTYWGPIPWLIEIAAVLSAVISHWPDFFIILFMLVLNSLIEFIQSSKAQDALGACRTYH
ncbi:MAG: cation-transporting P-type ATPase [Endozoicomonas sp.]|uniref:cation-transporting P-type ATPase n=1 Tax=Endozoicomonas sp. TaxID=1892382 RepID=UPI003D9AFD10